MAKEPEDMDVEDLNIADGDEIPESEEEITQTDEPVEDEA